MSHCSVENAAVYMEYKKDCERMTGTGTNLAILLKSWEFISKSLTFK